jgi:hypothetical protein
MQESEKPEDAVEAAAARVVELEAELEASADTTTKGAQLERSREILHRWVDSVVGVVATPGVGRVVLIHDSGRESRIASVDLTKQLSLPVSFTKSPD